MNELVYVSVQDPIDIGRFVLRPRVFDQPVRVQHLIAYLRAERDVHLAGCEFGGAFAAFFEFEFVQF